MDSELEYGEYPFKLSLHKYDLKTYKSLLKKMGESTVGSKPELYMRLKNRMESDWDEKVKQDEEVGYAKQMGLPMPVFVKPAPPKKQRKPRAKKITKELGIADRSFMTHAMLKEHARKYGLKVTGTKPVLIARLDEYLKKIDYDPESDTEIPAPIVKDKNERMTLSRMPLTMLKDLCKENGLPVSGKKSVLIDRLIEFLNRTPIKMEDIPELVRKQKDVARKPKLKSKPTPKPIPHSIVPLEESTPPAEPVKKEITIKRIISKSLRNMFIELVKSYDYDTLTPEFIKSTCKKLIDLAIKSVTDYVHKRQSVEAHNKLVEDSIDFVIILRKAYLEKFPGKSLDISRMITNLQKKLMGDEVYQSKIRKHSETITEID